MDSTLDPSHSHVAVVGAGMAGLTCANRLALSDIPVAVFEKSRGVGGRMSTRRARWQDACGQQQDAAFDHGTPAFGAQVPAFRAAVELAMARGWLQTWSPRRPALPSGAPNPGPQWLATPGANGWCERLARWLDVRRQHQVVSLRQTGQQWWLIMVDGSRAGPFTHVVLAMPPAQAAPLLAPHRADWSLIVGEWPTAACWTLMGVSQGEPPAWEMHRPSSGPLSLIVRNNTKPGRRAHAGHTMWVAQAHADWSQANLEAPAEAVQSHLQQALAEQLGHMPDWRACWVHRWRYAHTQRHAHSPRGTHWLDVGQGLGVCGDYLGGSGVEGAWLSGHALAEAMLEATSRPLLSQLPDAFAF